MTSDLIEPVRLEADRTTAAILVTFVAAVAWGCGDGRDSVSRDGRESRAHQIDQLPLLVQLGERLRSEDHTAREELRNIIRDAGREHVVDRSLRHIGYDPAVWPQFDRVAAHVARTSDSDSVSDMIGRLLSIPDLVLDAPEFFVDGTLPSAAASDIELAQPLLARWRAWKEPLLAPMDVMECYRSSEDPQARLILLLRVAASAPNPMTRELIEDVAGLLPELGTSHEKRQYIVPSVASIFVICGAHGPTANRALPALTAFWRSNRTPELAFLIWTAVDRIQPHLRPTGSTVNAKRVDGASLVPHESTALGVASNQWVDPDHATYSSHFLEPQGGHRVFFGAQVRGVASYHLEFLFDRMNRLRRTVMWRMDRELTELPLVGGQVSYRVADGEIVIEYSLLPERNSFRIPIKGKCVVRPTDEYWPNWP